MPGSITGDMVKPGAVVIDVGTTRVADPSKKSGFRLAGDIVFDEAKEVASDECSNCGEIGCEGLTRRFHGC